MNFRKGKIHSADQPCLKGWYEKCQRLGKGNSFLAKERLVQRLGSRGVQATIKHWKGCRFKKDCKDLIAKCIEETDWRQRVAGKDTSQAKLIFSQYTIWQLLLSTPVSVLNGRCPWHTSQSCQTWVTDCERGMSYILCAYLSFVFVIMYCYLDSLVTVISEFAL